MAVAEWSMPDAVDDERAEQFAPLSVLDGEGNADPELLDELGLDDDELRELYVDLVVARRVDAEAIALQRQGQLGVYASLKGQEAAQIGSARALRATDWVFPSYREVGVAHVRGVDVADLLHMWRGTWHGHHDPYENRFFLYAIPIATQVLHAVGFARGVALDGAGDAVLCYLGDGATSEGDAHEGLNFAGVWEAPIVFFVQNNQYAISLPFRQQTHAATVAQKAAGYGFPGLRCDGNDVLASMLAVQRALDRARGGGGPTLVEALTYRMEAHTTADDAARYREADELEHWQQMDPLTRYERFLKSSDRWDDDLQEHATRRASTEAAAVRDAIFDAPAPDPDELFDHVYVDPPSDFVRQRAQLRSERLSD